MCCTTLIHFFIDTQTCLRGWRVTRDGTLVGKNDPDEGHSFIQTCYLERQLAKQQQPEVLGEAARNANLEEIAQHLGADGPGRCDV